MASPLTLLREYVTVLKALLAGQSVTVDGRYVRLDRVQLDWPPQQHVPVLIGGIGPKTLQLAGEIGDGVILDAQHKEGTLRDALGHVASGRPAVSETEFSTVSFVACSADDATRTVGPHLDAGVDTVVLQPVGTQDALTELITAAGDLAQRHVR